MNYQDKLYDLTQFRQLDEEDPGALYKIISVFIDTTPEIVNDLNQALQQNDLENLAHYAHKLKATIDILNIKPLTGVIREIEQIALSGGEIRQLYSLVKEVSDTLQRVFIEIRKEIN